MSDNRGELNIIKLRSITNEMEFMLIKEILADNNIPYIVEDQGPGGHFRIIGGGSIFGTDIMINEDDFDDAISLLESIGIE